MHVGIYVVMFALPTSQNHSRIFIDNTFYLHQKYQNIVSKKMSFFVACGKFECSLPQNCAILHLMISSNDFLWNTLACWKTTDKSNANIIQFSQKSSFCANGKFIDFEMALRGRAFSPIGAMRNFARGIFCWVVGIWQGVFLTIWTFFKANENKILYILNLNYDQS